VVCQSMDPDPVSGSLLLFRSPSSDSRPDSEAAGDGARPAALAAECGWLIAASIHSSGLCLAYGSPRYNSVLRLSVSYIARLYKSMYPWSLRLRVSFRFELIPLSGANALW